MSWTVCDWYEPSLLSAFTGKTSWIVGWNLNTWISKRTAVRLGVRRVRANGMKCSIELENYMSIKSARAFAASCIDRLWQFSFPAVKMKCSAFYVLFLRRDKNIKCLYVKHTHTCTYSLLLSVFGCVNLGQIRCYSVMDDNVWHLKDFQVVVKVQSKVTGT